MDHYHPETVFSSIDEFGRYAYHNQPRIARWNLGVLAQCFLPILHENEDAAVQLAQDAIDAFAPQFDQAFKTGLCRKIGLNLNEDNMALAVAYLDLLQEHNLDFTNGFRKLVALDPAEIAVNANKFEGDSWRDWHGKWAAAHDNENTSLAARQEIMRLSNPHFIPRNHLMERMIAEAMDGDLSLFNTLNKVYQRPYDDQPEFDAFTAPPTNDERVLRTFCGT
jgi:uncharacterized protein YdiU (UPF0061 family)